MQTITYDEAIELACQILDGFDYDTIVNEGRQAEVEDAMYELFNIDFYSFRILVTNLLALTPVVKSELTGTPYHAFLAQIPGGYHKALVKRKVEQSKDKQV